MTARHVAAGSRPAGPLDPPGPPLRFPAADPPRLLVVIDTEEEFDWSAPPSRDATSVRAMARADRLDAIFARYGIVPSWMVDWPVAAQPEGAAPLVDFHRAGRIDVGAHLHPWVTPPFDEELCARNTYPGNLPAALEAAKLANLTDKLTEVFGRRPTSYKAGRYGLGPHTGELLERLGYGIDLSVCPTLDSTADGGPDYTARDCEPRRFGRSRTLLELPLTAGFTGVLGPSGRGVYRAATAPALAPLRLPAVLSRLRLVDRLVLSPEGFTPAEHRRLTRDLLARGVRVFTWSFHSPSVLPGGTPYVHTEADVQRFLDSFARYFDWFFGTLGGVPTTPGEVAAAFADGSSRTGNAR